MNTALLRAQHLLRAPLLSPTTLPSVIHVAATRGNAHPTNNLPLSDAVNLHLHTLQTSAIQQMEREEDDSSIDTSDDYFLLCFFRALSSHVLTTGSNLRSEPDLVISSPL